MAAEFLHGHRASLVATGLLDAETSSGDLLDVWVAGHDHLHQGSTVLVALGRVGSDPTTVDTSMAVSVRSGQRARSSPGRTGRPIRVMSWYSARQAGSPGVTGSRNRPRTSVDSR